MIDVRRGGERFRTKLDWLDSRHSFSFGQHYDERNTHHGTLLVHNEDVVAPGGGFDTHPHRDMEIVTWVLSGALAHRDSEGHAGVVHPGLVQRMSAGTGIRHSERNDSATEPVHFVQMWVLPDEVGMPPGYEQAPVAEALSGGGLVPVASGMARYADRAAIRIGNAGATLHVARLSAGESVRLPEAPHLHVFVVRGSVELAGVGLLAAGDAARLTAAGAPALAGSGTGPEPAEVLVWEMQGERLGGP